MSFKPEESAISRGAAQGGVLLLREAGRAVGLTLRLAGCFADCRSRNRVERPVRQLVGQRLFGLGYGDLNDHDKLRDDSLLAPAGADLTGENRVRERDRGIRWPEP